MKTQNVELRLLVNGRPITEYQHQGKTYVEGRGGKNFELEIRNNNHFRIETIISVDGLSIVDGQEASDTSKGYLIDAQHTVRIPGWLLDSKNAASFVFAAKNRSYATSVTGSSNNNGVIGLIAFRERPAIVAQPNWSHANCWPSPDLTGWPGNRSVWGTSVGNVAPSLSSTNGLSRGLGTGFGEQTDFSTTMVDFRRGSRLGQLVLYYDNARGLKARGIEITKKSKTVFDEPNPFPGVGCRPPVGWRG